MNDEISPLNRVYIGDEITPVFKNPVFLTKTPGCPDGFVWRETTYDIRELVSQWQDFERKGNMSRNMRDAHARRAVLRGSLGVGRFYFQVRTADARVFELYYDRVVKNAAESAGRWVLFQELIFE